MSPVTTPPASPAPEDAPYGPFLTRNRAHWAQLASANNLSLEPGTLEGLRGLDDPTDEDDVREVYLPLTQLLALYMERTGALYHSTHKYLRVKGRRTPFVIGVAGSVAVGKSTTARLLQALLRQLPNKPKVDLITTDGFLYPNAVLEGLGLMNRKGFPESYDRHALLQFVMDVKSGAPEVSAPVYSHLVYDIVPDEKIVVRAPDVLIVEGLNVLQPARRRTDGTTALGLSDFFDFSVYVDASRTNIRDWYIHRFLSLRETAFKDPTSFFRQFGDMSDEEATRTAAHVWDTINGPNLTYNIRPTRGRATAILRKTKNHKVSWVRIRKV